MLVLAPPWSLQYLPEEEGGFPLQPQFCDATTTGVDVAGETPPKRPQVSEILKSRLAAKEKKKSGEFPRSITTRRKDWKDPGAYDLSESLIGSIAWGGGGETATENGMIHIPCTTLDKTY